MIDKTHQFIERAQDIHGHKYTYDNTVYVHSTQKVVVTCPAHGDFLITPNNHMSSKQGCQRCSNRHRPTVDEFIAAARDIHGNRYNYSSVQYTNNKTPVTVECLQHGTFEVCPRDHLHKKSGCPACANVVKGAYHKKDTQWFTQQATLLHGNAYDYSRVQYQRYHDKVEITCPHHGVFLQSANLHIGRGAGCPTCSIKDYEGGYGKTRFKNHPHLKTKPGTLYLIRAYSDNEDFIKVGITQKTIQHRFDASNRLPYSYEVLCTLEGNLYDMFLLEQQAKTMWKSYRYYPSLRFRGHTECFSLDACEHIEKSIFK